MVEGHVGNRAGSSPVIHTTFFSLKNGGLPYAGVAELADAPDSKSGDGDIVWVRAPPPVPFSKIRQGGNYAEQYC